MLSIFKPVLCASQVDSLFTKMGFIQWIPGKEDSVSMQDEAYSRRDC